MRLRTSWQRTARSHRARAVRSVQGVALIIGAVLYFSPEWYTEDENKEERSLESRAKNAKHSAPAPGEEITRNDATGMNTRHVRKITILIQPLKRDVEGWWIGMSDRRKAKRDITLQQEV